MRVETTTLPGVLLLIPVPSSDDRGFFTRTFDTEIFDAHQYASGGSVRSGDFTQDSQSRSHPQVVRGMHGRLGRGEAKLVRCARGSVLDVLVDARPGSPTFGRQESFVLDDVTHAHLFVPPGMLHGFQVTSDIDADVCYRIDRPHEPSEDVSVAFDDPDLQIAWPLPIGVVSTRDRAAGTWEDLTRRLEQ
ncbi:dTDP-4-dehydrorhamnose 3,5-epimerase family protein [Aeromicrobium sp. CF3.5]|uniref:dTDP-4-dehydrorhamnose 3,5-epimerase family protein n=1 Tax=Aeromicrobium sp. CF3.5 TaxID=3373078 RepID=UPI003EE787AA